MSNKFSPQEPEDNHPENYHPENEQPSSQPEPLEAFPGDSAYGHAADATYGATGYQTTGGYPGSEYAAAGYPGAMYPGEVQEKNNMALWAMILGIVGFVLTVSIVGAVIGIGILLGIVAIVLGILGIRRAGRMEGPNRRKGMAISGIVLGALSIVASIAIFLGLFSMLSWFADTGIMETCAPFQEDQEAYRQCIEEETAKLAQ
ncbi:DUF4190 domain-containing protein [Corynebacterium pilosum]|uniref:Transmembrane protein n=1 Tax=Corynebacterium pilosum TaxID=35756 RepID=A0A376CQN3_9CORY|nr:DUF4190 domain-containing protein [Corynebacterium pilosum]STC70605.1 transmembrane protein [Corynebacterium pilosum]